MFPMIKEKEISADVPLIKSPFVMGKSLSQVRISLDKDPRKMIGNTDRIYQQKLENGNIQLVNEIDPRLEFVIGDKEQEQNDLVHQNKYDYEVPAEVLNQTSKHKHTEGLPLSFLNIDNEKDGIEWYKQHFPKIPEELYPIIARHHWGEPITKKTIKNEKKKMEKKAQAKGLVIENKKVSVSFD
jgi:hypothetical protein